MADDELLSVLQKQGLEFLNSFSLPNSNQRKRKRATDDGNLTNKVSRVAQDGEESDSQDEWLGISRHSPMLGESNSPGERSGENDDDGFEQEDDAFTADASSRTADVVVFSDTRNNSTPPITSKAHRKTFMSSKVSKLTQIIDDAAHVEEPNEDASDERTNLQNDALLHRLVHTKLLSGSLNSELELTPAQRKKALAGRILEVSAGVKLGKGEKVVRETERNKAAKRVREGLLAKKKEREKNELEEAKNLGNYHPTLKKLFEPSSSSATTSKRRDRGIKMGVGRFSGGMLKLSREEISAAQGSGSRGRTSRGRGGGRGRGRKTT